MQSTLMMLAYFGFVIVFVLHRYALSCREDSEGGFDVELIHRNSPKSPYYNPTEAPYQRVRKMVVQSISRVKHLTRIIDLGLDPVSELAYDHQAYLVNVSVRTPPFPIMGIMDTGSSLVWTQCIPCRKCYKQVAPLFDPSKSMSYQDVPCPSRECSMFTDTTCDKTRCAYSYYYGDESFSKGYIARETITLGSISGEAVPFNQTLIGCGHKDGGTFHEKVSGIVDLGGEPYSLVSQMGQDIGGRFSYCLVPYSDTMQKSGLLSFGSNAVVSGPGTVSTSLTYDKYYYLTLEAISIRGFRIEVHNLSASNQSPGNIVIDSGTMFTLLPQKVYSQMRAVVVSMIKLEQVLDPLQIVNLCYRTEAEIDAPTIIFHFRGADVALGPSNTFFRVSDDTVYFYFIPYDSTPLYGNLLQRNFLVGYDTQNNIVSFKPTDCLKFDVKPKI